VLSAAATRGGVPPGLLGDRDPRPGIAQVAIDVMATESPAQHADLNAARCG